MKQIKIILIAVLTLQMACAKSGSNSAANAPLPQSPQQTPQQYPKAKIQANLLAKAMIEGDYSTAADLTNPKLVQQLGGREKYIQEIQQSRKEIESSTTRILSDEVADPTDIIVEGKEIYAILPNTTRIKVPEGVLVGEAYMIGVSLDGGENWTFTDAESGANREQLRILFPSVADRLKLPEPKRPVLQRDPPNRR